ncbi:hypothetical protein [Gordonia zhaorongruii]|uniref:hypothetical protein n=1 Tax=Gordonia zhaorongruii TaxID=2597659 RepID=UPI00104C32BA|nr:hypothetical protein [Gordonia zhaorongruii]
MTAATPVHDTGTPTGSARIAKVIRLQLINPQTFVVLPLVILGASFAISMMIFGVIAYSVDDMTDPLYGGGSQAPLWYFMVIGVQALSFTFPFSQALSITRREYFLGTFATAGLTSLTLAITFLIGGVIEQATDGWWFDGYFFYVPWIWDQGAVVAALLYLVIAMFAFTVGFWATTIYKRWGTSSLVAVGVGLAVVLIVVAFVISWQGGWPSFGRWFADLQPVVAALLILAVDAVLAGLSYLTIRKAIP